MASTAHVKRVLKPLIERHNDLAIVGRSIIVKPVGHFLRAVLIDRTSSADRFSPRWYVWHLFEVMGSAALNFDHLLTNPGNGFLWKHSMPNIDTILIDQIERTALPALRTLRTLDDFIAHVSKYHCQYHFLWPTVKVIVDVAMGDLDAARELCRTHIEPRDEATFGRDEDDKAKLRRLKELCRRLARDDRAGLAALLHEWEAATVKNLKLEKYWEPSPFPLEAQAG